MNHAPKWRALLAFHADLLSESARAHVGRHLDECPVCADAWARIAAYGRVSTEVRDQPVPALDLDSLAVLHASGADVDALGRIGALAELIEEVRDQKAPTLDFEGMAARLFSDDASWRSEEEDAHEPKWRALVAYQEGSLSEAGRRRLERHLDECDVCTEALIRMDAYEGVSDTIRETDPQIDFPKIELAVRREAAARARRRSLAFTVLAAAAAIGLVVTIQQESPEPTRVPIPGEALAVREAPSPTRIATVVAVGGNARSDQGALFVGAVLEEGDSVDLVDGAVHARLDSDTGFALHGDARLVLAHVREDGVELDLQSGRVSNQVRTGTVYAIAAGEYSVHVRGTVFEVVRNAGEVAVTVDEGVVEVRRGDEVVALLPAPATWSSAADLEARAQGEVPIPRPLDGAELRLPASERIVRWEIDGSTFDALGELAMRVPLGPQTLVGFDEEGERWVAEIDMLPEGLRLEEASLEHDRPRPAVGYISPEAIQAVVRPHVRELQRCYERTLRRAHPELQGVFSLRVQVRHDGTVGRVSVNTDGDSPERFTQCLRIVARQWVFPEPEGGPRAYIDLPLNFATR